MPGSERRTPPEPPEEPRVTGRLGRPLPERRHVERHHGHAPAVDRPREQDGASGPRQTGSRT
ncbi:hypothetical protein [Streptomyces sp. NPDC093089]|uniref:hypothetical protein n=1 Tax=Streptomyces sp. NPDC093089 TaxID=3366024 RepID=UPI003821463C